MPHQSNDLIKEAAHTLGKAGIERPLFEAQLLLAHALGLARSDVIREPDRPITDNESEQFRQLVARRSLREPLAYIRGSQEFYGLEFKVTPAVLIPRPETELLVDFAREVAADTMIDVGTGSGCIAIAAAVHLPEATVIGLDQSEAALAIAHENALRLSADVRFVKSDLMQPIRIQWVDLVVSNPPYIPSNEIAGLQPEVRDYEPEVALDGGPGGLDFIHRIVADSRRVLRHRAWLALEVALGQAETVGNLLSAAGFESVDARKDLAGIERVIIGRAK